MSDCIFCKIANKEIPASVVYEDDDTIAFLSIGPVSRGHTLVIPKSHSEDLVSSDPEILAVTAKAAQKIAKGLLKATGAAGFNFTVNNGGAAGQEVFHLHIHLIPRYSNDGLKPWPHSELEPKTRDEMAAEIKKFL